MMKMEKNNYQNLNCLLAWVNILRVTLPELQSYKNIYNSFSNFLKKLKFNEDWIFDYIFWEIDLLKELGFDMNLKSDLALRHNDKKNMLKAVGRYGTCIIKGPFHFTVRLELHFHWQDPC